MIFTEGLKKNSDFRQVYKKGCSKANRYLVVYVLENGTEKNRLGVSVSKKVGNSVYRHYFKRCVKETYRLHEKMFNSGLDIVVLARQGAKDIRYSDIEGALLHLMRIHKVIK
ncbi:MAG: ribonuclease P protein component [Lachnospiraceae bacterium]|nr:ribonuclease P protein component [Lachnospiraceae bacterium]